MIAWLLLAVGAVCLAFHLATVGLFLLRRRWPDRAAGLIGQPPISLLRPIKGSDPADAETLGSSFVQDYPAYEVILCVETDADPAAAVARRLIAAHPAVPARLLVGTSTLTGNPKLNNLAKGWAAARHEWVCMTDANLLLPPHYLATIAAAWDAGCGLVSRATGRDGARNFAGRLECAFLNGNQARLQFAGDSLGFGFAQGKTLFWRRALLDGAGGLAALGAELAEDVNATKLVRAAGLHVRLTPLPFSQPVGRRTFRAVWDRQLRWSRLRRAGFPALLGAEIFNGLLAPLLAVWAGAALLGLSGGAILVILAGVTLVWYGAEALMLRASGLPAALPDLAALPLRDLLLPALWVASFIRGDIAWRGNAVAAPDGTPETRTNQETPTS